MKREQKGKRLEIRRHFTARDATRRGLVATAFLAASLAFGQGAAAAETADTIYTGGAIVTVNDAQPSA